MRSIAQLAVFTVKHYVQLFMGSLNRTRLTLKIWKFVTHWLLHVPGLNTRIHMHQTGYGALATCTQYAVLVSKVSSLFRY